MPFERRVGHKRLSVTRSWTMDTNILKIAGQIIIISDHFNKSWGAQDLLKPHKITFQGVGQMKIIIRLTPNEFVYFGKGAVNSIPKLLWNVLVQLWLHYVTETVEVCRRTAILSVSDTHRWIAICNSANGHMAVDFQQHEGSVSLTVLWLDVSKTESATVRQSVVSWELSREQYSHEKSRYHLARTKVYS